MKFIQKAYPSINQSLWYPLLYGASWFNGGMCYEYGVDLVTNNVQEFYPDIPVRLNQDKQQGEIICASRYDGTLVTYNHSPKPGLACWDGLELLSNGTKRSKSFHSSRWFNQQIAAFDFGETYKDYDLCPIITMPVGHARYDDLEEIDIFFVCNEGSRFFNHISDYYNLPRPLSSIQLATLESNPQIYRAGHFDLFKFGPGNYIPIVLASISFINKTPMRILFHTFQRPWEVSDRLNIEYF
jgi:hypothetical protein